MMFGGTFQFEKEKMLMRGKDGRFYDRSFDFDGDGKLNAYEYSVMDDVMFSSNVFAKISVMLVIKFGKNKVVV